MRIYHRIGCVNYFEETTRLVLVASFFLSSLLGSMGTVAFARPVLSEETSDQGFSEDANDRKSADSEPVGDSTGLADGLPVSDNGVAISLRSDLTLDELKRIGAARSRFRRALSNQKDASTSSGENTTAAHLRRLSQYTSRIAPVLQKHCGDCHSDDDAEGNFRIDTLDPDLVEGGDTDWWVELFSVVTKGEMPPADAEPLTDADRIQLVEWLSEELQVASEIKRKTQDASGFRRLTNYEYNYALQDLLGVTWDFSKDLPPEAQSEDGFVNRSDLLHVSVTQFEMYHRIAREALSRVIVNGDPPSSRHWLITADQLADREWKKQEEQYRKLAVEYKDQPEELSQQQAKLIEKFSQKPGGAHFYHLNNERFAPSQWQYYNAKYAFAPSKEPLEPPDSQDSVAVLPSGLGHKLIFELGDQLPDRGIMRVTAEVAAVEVENGTYPSLQLLFGWQASNEGRALLVVSDQDIPVTGTIKNPQLIQWEVPLGEIYPRNSVRNASPMGATPSPSEYIRILNTSASKSAVQIRYVAVSSPVYDHWPPQAHQRIFGAANAQLDEGERAKIVLANFMKRAWRGAVTEQDVEQKLARFYSIRERCESFEEAVGEVLAIVLSSPRFLYVSTKPPQNDRLEKQGSQNNLGEASGEATREPTDLTSVRVLSDFDLAERLSLFLWCSVPDDELLTLASKAKLGEPDVLLSQAKRMIRDPKGKRFVKQFVHQWLNLELLRFQNLKGKVPGFDPLLQQAMLEEPVEFIFELMQQDESLLNLVHGDFAVVNERLAKHYGIEGERGNHFRRVQLREDSKRGGLITQAGFLAMNSDWPDSHPLKRSVWLLERLLNDPPPPPPPAVPQIDLADPRIATMTLKERIEDHRNQPACASCHIKIDPWGIAFENFDALGRWRDSIDGKPVDSTSELFNGETLSGINGLKRFLIINRQDQLIHSVVEKLLAYSLGRSLTFSDQSEVEKVVRQVRLSDDGFQQALLAVVTSELFLQW